MNIFANVFAKMMARPGKTFGEAVAEATGGVNLVQGKQTWEFSETGKDDLEIMKQCCATELATFEKVGLVPAPYYFERVAILARRMKNFREEIAYCEKYIEVVEDHCRQNNIPSTEGMKMRPRYQAIVRRLSKARLLSEKATS
ncbi:MAG: hypothetical protein ACR2NX_10340 [Chthoniobacterales bacterium]